MRSLKTIFAAALFALTATAAHAQFIGYTAPQTNNVLAMNAVTVPSATPSGAGVQQCPAPAAGSCQIPNLGQTWHVLTYMTTSNVPIDIRIEGSNDGAVWFPISADATSFPSGALCGFGSYAALRINLLNITGSITVNYSGSSGISTCPLGVYNPAQQQTEIVYSNSGVGITEAHNIPLPYANTYGQLYISNATGALNAALTISSIDPAGGKSLFVYSLPSGGGSTQVPLPQSPATQLQISYTRTSGSTTGLNVAVVFYPPPQDQGSPALDITTATNAAVKASAPGTLFSLVINQVGSSGATAAIYDGNIGGGACTGTLLGTLNVATFIGTVWYGLQFNSGLCITTTGGTPADITVIYR